MTQPITHTVTECDYSDCPQTLQVIGCISFDHAVSVAVQLISEMTDGDTAAIETELRSGESGGMYIPDKYSDWSVCIDTLIIAPPPE